MKKIIYDLGSNNGDDISYYLLKCDLVVAVEANPSLCEEIRQRFRVEIEKGTLILENFALTNNKNQSSVDFFIHKTDHVKSQLLEPNPEEYSLFEKVKLPSTTVVALVQKHGHPYYLKSDVEHYDTEVLRALFNNGIFPEFISAEAHSIEIFSLFCALGGYKVFNSVDGASVSMKYRKHSIKLQNGGRTSYSFPNHSAGPFGEDISERWLVADDYFRRLAIEGLGWVDVHASKNEELLSDKGFSLKKHLLRVQSQRWATLFSARQ